MCYTTTVLLLNAIIPLRCSFSRHAPLLPPTAAQLFLLRVGGLSMVALSDVHRNLLQMLLHEGAYSQQDLLDLFEQCVDSHHGSAKVARIKWRPGDDEANEATLERMLMTEMNTYLDPIGLKVAKKRHRSRLHYGLVNLVSEAARVVGGGGGGCSHAGGQPSPHYCTTHAHARTHARTHAHAQPPIHSATSRCL